MEIKNHLLVGPNVKFVKTPTHGGPFKPGDLDTIVLHYTAGPNAQSALNSMINPSVKASAHLLIGRDNMIYQLVPFNIQSWHAGQSSYKGRVGYNQYSIGIEIDNAGILTPSGDVYHAWFGGKYSANDVVKAIHRNETVAKYWHAYTEEQIDILEQICQLLIDTYKITTILGHEEIAPGRKLDPGPAFPLDSFRQKLLEEDRDQDGQEDFVAFKRVSVPKLNIRTQPSTTADKLGEPLTEGTRVKIMDFQNGWYKVKVEKKMEGWVSADFIEKIKPV